MLRTKETKVSLFAFFLNLKNTLWWHNLFFGGFHLVIQSRGKNIFNIDVIDEIEINIINIPQSTFVSSKHSISLNFKIFWVLIIGVKYSFSHAVKGGITLSVV